MNSNIIKNGALLACAYVATQTEGAQAVNLNSNGIFGAMIEQATAGEKFAQEKHEASERKRK